MSEIWWERDVGIRNYNNKILSQLGVLYLSKDFQWETNRHKITSFILVVNIKLWTSALKYNIGRTKKGNFQCKEVEGYCVKLYKLYQIQIFSIYIYRTVNTGREWVIILSFEPGSRFHEWKNYSTFYY